MNKSDLTVTSHHRILGKRLLFTWGILVLVMIASTLTPVFAQSTAFTYQGTIEDGGTPANGTYDFEFALFDDLSAGTQVGSTLSPTGVQVANGAFSVSLDFGPEFPGAERFLEIRVRQSGAGDFTTLGPRQKINSAPYALKSLSSETAATADNALMLGGTAASEFVTTDDERLTDARDPLPGSNNYIRNSSTSQSAGFNISGPGVIGNRLAVGGPLSNYRIDAYGSIRSIGTSTNFATVETTGASSSVYFELKTPDQAWSIRNTPSGWFEVFDQTSLTSSILSLPDGGPVILARDVAVGGSTTQNSKLKVNGGSSWTSDDWTSSIELSDHSTLGWRPSPGGQSHGIGQRGGGLWFFRTSAVPGTGSETAATYDLAISSEGNIATNGSTKQPADKTGWAKALLRVQANGVVTLCYNGVTGVSSTGGGCGITVTRTQVGAYAIDFGFDVTIRYITATPIFDGGTIPVLQVYFPPGAPNIAAVSSNEMVTSIPTDSPFTIVVF